MARQKARWVTVAEAVTILSKSEKTIRRWVKSGQLKSRRDGRRVMVNVSGHESGQVPDIDRPTVGTSDQITIVRLEAELAGAFREITVLREAMDKQERQAEAWQAQAAALTSTVNQQSQLLLEAIITSESEPDPEPEKPRRWWKIW